MDRDLGILDGKTIYFVFKGSSMFSFSFMAIQIRNFQSFLRDNYNCPVIFTCKCLYCLILTFQTVGIVVTFKLQFSLIYIYIYMENIELSLSLDLIWVFCF